jgi:nucleoporin NUP2
VYSGLTVTRNKNVLSFVGHEDGKKATFRVKVKDEAGATALKQAIDDETAAVKSRESSVA